MVSNVEDVSYSSWVLLLQGERLYDFLERQVGDQMRTALKEPLHNISDNILNRVISKSI